MQNRLQKSPREPQAEVEPVGAMKSAPSESELRKMISEAAYYRAEKRGFAPGLETEDWREAEAEVLGRVRTHETRI